MDAYNKFNTQLLALARMVENNVHTPMQLHSLCMKMRLIIRTCPCLPLNILSKFIYQCRDEIRNKNIAYFLALDLSDFPVEDYVNINDIVLLKTQFYPKLNEREMNMYWDIWSSLLEICEEYIISKKDGKGTH